MVNIVDNTIKLKLSKKCWWNIWLEKAFKLALIIHLETKNLLSPMLSPHLPTSKQR